MRTAPVLRAVPAELIGREVSVRALISLCDAARARHIPLDRLAAGTGCSLAQLANPRERVSWAAFSRFLSNLGDVVGDDELVRLGGAALEAPLLRALLLPGRLLFGVADVYRWTFRPNGPAAQMIATTQVQMIELAPGRLRFEVVMKPGYPPSRENHLLLRGSLMTLSRALGARPAEVTQHSLDGGALYHITVPTQRGALGFARKQLLWMTDARAAADELQRAHGELYERYAELQREFEARIRVEAELRRLNDELELRVAERTAALETANRELATFNYSVSHDLHAPLRSINGFSKALLEDYGAQLDGRARDYLGRIRGAAVRMGELIDGLLQLSRVTRSPLRHELIDLSAVARAVVDELARVEPERRVAVVIADRLAAHGDARLISIVLENLLGNAWKFTTGRPDAEIELGARHDRDGTAFFVRDNGAGFDREHADRLFEPFFRLHTGEQFPGSGIGLATVHRIVARHGGRIWAEGVPGGGATFWFTLPGSDS